MKQVLLAHLSKPQVNQHSNTIKHLTVPNAVQSVEANTQKEEARGKNFICGSFYDEKESKINVRGVILASVGYNKS